MNLKLLFLLLVTCVSSLSAQPSKYIYPFKDKFLEMDSLVLLSEIGDKSDWKKQPTQLPLFTTRFSDSCILEEGIFYLGANKKPVFQAKNTPILLTEISGWEEGGNSLRRWIPVSGGVILLSRGLYTFSVQKYDIHGQLIWEKSVPYSKKLKLGGEIKVIPYMQFKTWSDKYLFFSSASEEYPQSIWVNTADGTLSWFETNASFFLSDPVTLAMKAMLTVDQRGWVHFMSEGREWGVFEKALTVLTEVKMIYTEEMVILACFNPQKTGLKVFAFEAEKGAKQWDAELDLLRVNHSQPYKNEVFLSCYKDKIIVESQESYDTLLQVIETKTGKKLWSSLGKK